MGEGWTGDTGGIGHAGVALSGDNVDGIHADADGIHAFTYLKRASPGRHAHDSGSASSDGVNIALKRNTMSRSNAISGCWSSSSGASPERYSGKSEGADGNPTWRKWSFGGAGSAHSVAAAQT